jgi:MFS family permease
MKPSRVRFGVLAFVSALSMITYLDRAAFPIVNQHVLAALDLATLDDLTLAFTAFNLAYALFEVPTGWLGDVFGPRMTLIRIVLWWSFFIALTGLVGEVSGVSLFGKPLPGFYLYGFTALVAIRFLFGAGEAGAYPNIARAIYNWFPLRERGRASGTVWMSARLMGGLTALIMTLLLTRLHLHWRSVFLLFGALGLVWCIAFAIWFRNRPEEKPTVNEAERALIAGDRGPAEVHGGVPWRKIIASRSVRALCLMYICTNYGWYFSMNYLPGFLEGQYGVEKDSLIGSLYKGSPMLVGMAGCFVGGLLTDHHIRRTGDKRWGRRLYGVLGHGLCGLCMLTLPLIPTQPQFAWLFALMIATAGFFNDTTMAPAWASCQDVGQRYSAIVSGCMNMIGNLGGALTTFLSGRIVTWYIRAAADRAGVTEKVFKTSELFVSSRLQAERDGWHLNFLIYGGVYLLAIVFWMMLDARKPVEVADAET